MVHGESLLQFKADLAGLLRRWCQYICIENVQIFIILWALVALFRVWRVHRTLIYPHLYLLGHKRLIFSLKGRIELGSQNSIYLSHLLSIIHIWMVNGQTIRDCEDVIHNWSNNGRIINDKKQSLEICDQTLFVIAVLTCHGNLSLWES